MTKKLNILFLSSWYPNNLTPKNGNFIQKHAEAVSKYCSVFVLHIVANDQEKEFVVDNAIRNNVNETIVYYKKIKSKAPIFSSISKLSIRQKAYELGYKKIIEVAKHINITHLNVTFPAGIFALHLYEKFNIPYIITEHWTAFLKISPTKINNIEKYYIKKIAKKALLICPVSENLKQEMINFGITNSFKVVPNVVDTKIFKSNPINHKKKPFKILHISNLKDEHKNITGIINVVKKLSKKRNDFVVTIAGNGDYKAYQKTIIDLNIPDENIVFDGGKTTNEVAQLMNVNDVFILFSNYENLPCVIAESLVTGTPIIATNVGGVKEMLNHENGIIIDPHNETELLNKLDYFIDNISNYNTTKIAAEAKKIYSYETVGEQFYNMYTNILKA